MLSEWKKKTRGRSPSAIASVLLYYRGAGSAHRPYAAHGVISTWDAAHVCDKCGGLFGQEAARREKERGRRAPGTETRMAKDI